MKWGCLGLVAFVIFGAIVSQYGDRVSSNTPVDAVTPQQRALQNAELVEFKWQKAGFGAVMLADFKIRNKGKVAIKDITITCTHSGASGTEIDKSRKTIYDTVDAGKTREFKDVNMGFINQQTSQSGCGITGVVPVE